MRDPFKIEGPAVISFSWGRTSGLMLYRILQSHGGTLPADVKVVFCNTGKERPETLDFVERCSAEWGVPMVWLEYRYDGANYDAPKPRAVEGHSFAVVDYATASRNGEPFADVLTAFAEFRKANAKDPVLPNVAQRFCTVEMKMRTLQRWGWEYLGWGDAWLNAVGLRADEPQRVAKARQSKRLGAGVPAR